MNERQVKIEQVEILNGFMDGASCFETHIYVDGKWIGEGTDSEKLLEQVVIALGATVERTTRTEEVE